MTIPDPLSYGRQSGFFVVSLARNSLFLCSGLLASVERGLSTLIYLIILQMA